LYLCKFKSEWKETDKLMKRVSLKAYNTFGIDVWADEILFVRQDAELKDFLQSGKVQKPFLVLGEGANILFTKDFEGTVLKMETKGVEMVSEDANRVVLRVKAGENWDDFVRYSLSKGYFGLENLALIPGKAGSSPIQNIGAYGKEVKNFITKVHALSVKDAVLRTFSNAECAFGYRSSIFKNTLKGQYIITDVEFTLTKKADLDIHYADLKQILNPNTAVSPQDVYNAVVAVRNAKLPDYKVFGNAGSFFKNPIISTDYFEKLKQKYHHLTYYPVSTDAVKLAAGQLIDLLDWKGKRIGNAGVHPQQALVLVNYGNAFGLEILHLAHEIQKDVFAHFGINLEMEVNVV
jgi:UDP-N-acetylmuramate dehydrogenase